jgi:hypothetical protein
MPIWTFNKHVKNVTNNSSLMAETKKATEILDISYKLMISVARENFIMHEKLNTF